VKERRSRSESEWGEKKRLEDRRDEFRNLTCSIISPISLYTALPSIERMQQSDRLLHRKPPQPASPPLVAVSTSFPLSTHEPPLELTSDPRLDKRSDDYHPLQQQVPTSPSKPGYLLDRVRLPSFPLSLSLSPHIQTLAETLVWDD